MFLFYQILQNTFQNEYLLSLVYNHYEHDKPQPWIRLQFNTKLQPRISVFNEQDGVKISLWTYRYPRIVPSSNLGQDTDHLGQYSS